MPFKSFDAEKAAKAAEEFSEQMGEIYRHECYGQRKRECKSMFHIVYFSIIESFTLDALMVLVH